MAAPNPNWLPAFLKFCSVITITSKEKGRVPLVPYEAQKRFLRELHLGLERDIHYFVCLKARQLGCSTLMLALDLFWLYANPGLQGALIYDNAKNTQQARLLITDMLSSLPPEWSVPVEVHNRDALVLSNGSSLQYMSAGKGKNSGLGRSRALNYVHASETSGWGDQDGIDSLLAAMAEEHPDRLYLFESTALGFNVFFDLYQKAKIDPQQHAFFLGWWSKETYQYPEDHPVFEQYWLSEPQLSEDEAVLQHTVQEQYSHDITPQQWSWYRYRSAGQGEGSFRQEFPTHEDEAWQSTGQVYFPVKRITSDLAYLYQQGSKAGFLGFRYHYGLRFNQLTCESVDNVDDVELRVWEQPKAGAYYAIGMDVAYGREDTNDRTVISVWRCFSDKMIQVAEYATTEPTEREATWVLAHLAGCYQNVILNIEVNGPGGAVMNEMKNLKQQLVDQSFKDVGPQIDPKWTLDHARWFLYHRVDSIGANYVYNTVTTSSIKSRYCSGFRDAYKFEEALIRSIPLLHELTTFVQNGVALEASGRNKDDRIMAATFAWAAWDEHIKPMLRALGHDYKTVMENERRTAEGVPSLTQWIVKDMFARAEEEREAASRPRILEV